MSSFSSLLMTMIITAITMTSRVLGCATWTSVATIMLADRQISRKLRDRAAIPGDLCYSIQQYLSWNLKDSAQLRALLAAIEQNKVKGFRLEIKAEGENRLVMRGLLGEYSKDTRPGSRDGDGILKVFPNIHDEFARPIRDALDPSLDRELGLRMTLNDQKSKFDVCVTNKAGTVNHWVMIHLLEQNGTKIQGYDVIGDGETRPLDIHFAHLRIEPTKVESWNLMAINPLCDLLEQIQQNRIKKFRLEIKAGGRRQEKDLVMKGSFGRYIADDSERPQDGKGVLQVIPDIDDETMGPIRDAMMPSTMMPPWDRGMKLRVTLTRLERRFSLFVTNKQRTWICWKMICIGGTKHPLQNKGTYDPEGFDQEPLEIYSAILQIFE